jgi:hypothetical protein
LPIIAAAQYLDHVDGGIGREGCHRLFGGLLHHRRIDPNAFHAAGRRDGPVDRHLPGELQVDRAADVE